MVRIILTSDLHLKVDSEERLQAFREVLRVGREHQSDWIIIAGDLFDSPHDARRLRPKLREILRGNTLPVMVIPGNHDHNCYEENLDFGDNFLPQTERPFTIVDGDGCRLVFIPYFEGDLTSLLPELQAAKNPGMINILIIHGSLDLTGLSRLDFGEEKEYRYLPITEGLVKELSYNYILAGHYHTEAVLRKIGRTRFIYPGSPVTITKREIGRRHLYLIDTSSTPKLVPLKTRYYQPIEIYVYPGEEKKALVELKRIIQRHDPNLAQLEITIRGFIQVNEKDFRGVISMIVGDQKVHNEWRQVSDLISEPLYRRIRKKLDESNLNPEQKRRVELLLMEAMIR